MDVVDNSQMLKLISKENTEHSINFNLFSKFSLFIKDNIVDQNVNEALTCALSSSQIEQMLQFVKEREHDYIYKAIPKPIPSGNIVLYLQEKDYNFLTSIKSEDELYVLLKSAQYFRIEIITEMIYAYIAAQFIDKTSEETRNKYGIQELHTEQADKNLRESYAEFLTGTPFDE